ncbi:MAG: alpha-L-fucosidase, partial [Planctomycetes bacterium]|nr:alpha-L-fucosidase [Planctomycetota bacterium]
MKELGAWHGKKFTFGFHYDLHAQERDMDLGLRCSRKELVPMLKLMNPDFVQTDCKGHPGYTSWFSKTPGASVPKGLKKDALKQWREATQELGLPLHCHYSGIWDKAAGQKNKKWTVTGPGGKLLGDPCEASKHLPNYEKMCPRGPYLDQLMIPQLKELIDRYRVDGFWIDGDIWAVFPCYCKLCKKAFKSKTGIEAPPTYPKHPDWPVWMRFVRTSFDEYVNRYCDAVHAHKKGVLVCSNWLQTFKDPGEPTARTDWISGDNHWVWGMDGSRCEARFISTRGK